MTTKVDISAKSILFTIATLLALGALYQVRGVIVLLFISFILMSALHPLVKKTSKFKIPKAVTILAVYLLFILLLVGMVASLLPAIIQQTSSFVTQLPSLLSRLLDFNIDFGIISNQFGSIPTNILRVAAGAFSNILAIFTLFVITYYMLVERDNLHKYLVRFFGNNGAEQKAENFVKDLEKKIGSWVRGQVTLMFLIGVMTYLGLLLLGIPYALPLAVLAGLLEIVPNIGPTVAAIPAVLVGFTVSPLIGLGALALAVLVQQLENNLIVPKVMQKATGINPLVIITVLLMGLALAGVIGMVLAVPTYMLLSTIIEYLET